MSVLWVCGALKVHLFIYLYCAVVDRKHVTRNQQSLKFMITAESSCIVGEKHGLYSKNRDISIL